MKIKCQIVLCAALILTLSSLASGQDSRWFANLNINPYPSPYYADWERNPSLGSMFVSYSGMQGTSFYFRSTIVSRRYGEIFTATSDVILVLRAFRQTYYSTDFVDWNDVDYNEDIERIAIRTGRFPEGEYTLTVEIYHGNTLLAVDSAPFYIVYPDPPQLLQPTNGSTETVPQPVFQWIPVITPSDYTITYHLLIVERLPRQSLQRAIEANYPQHEANIVGLGIYNYPISGLAFDIGKEYVWQITATDQYGYPPTSNNGKSEIWSFVYGAGEGGIVEELPFDTLTIAEGFAYLINLNDLTITESQTTYTFNGRTELIFHFIDNLQEYTSVMADINNLVISKSNIETPTFYSGEISGDLSSGDIPQAYIGDYFIPDRLHFSQAEGLTVEGHLIIPALAGDYVLTGRLQLGAGGITGTASASGAPLFQLGNDIASVNINRAVISFSAPTISFEGTVNLFGEEASCSLTDLTLGLDGSITGQITCADEMMVPLVEGSDRFTLGIHNLAGSFSGNISGGDLDFDILASAGLDFHPDETTNFGADIAVRLQPSGISVESFTPRADLEFSAIDLDWLELQISNLSLSNLSYTSGVWDFALGLDMVFGFPELDSLTMPSISGITFTPRGFTIPATDIPSLYLPRINLEGFELELMGFRMPAFTFSWFDWNNNNLADFGFNFDLRLRFPDFPEGTPIELRDPEIIINNASFINGNFNASIPTISFAEPGWRLPLGGEIAFNVQEIAGALGGSFAAGAFIFNPDVRLRGTLQLPPEFSCEGDQSLSLLSTSVQVLGDGRLNGTIENIIPPCPLQIGLLSLAVSSSTLNFYTEEGNQRIRIDGAAGLGFESPSGEPINASVTFSYEFIENNLISLNGNIRTPFVWNIPPENPALSFNISRADFDAQGLTIDGRQSLRFTDETTLGVTFDHLNISWDNFRINSGSVTFDTPFAFKVAFDGENLVYRAVPRGTVLTEPIGILLELPDAITIGADGFSASGQAGIHLKFDEYNLPSLTGNYSQDFAISLNPFKVSAGQLEFFSDNLRIAIINSRGFFPDLSFFGMAFLPERLPLPVEEIAYLQLKTGDSLLVNFETLDAGLHLYTRPGRPVNLVMTALQLGRPQPPQVGINFDIVIDPLTRDLVSGSLNVAIPPERYLDFDLSSLGIPFQLRNINYGNIGGLNGFHLDGLLKLFDTSLEAQNIQLTLMPDGRLLGDINFPMSQQIPLVTGSENLTLNISNISGSFETRFVPLNIDFDLSITGGIRLNLDETTSYGASTTLNVTPHGISLADFNVDELAQMPQLDLGTLNLLFDNFTIPHLNYSSISGWDFEIGIDLGLGFPDLSFQLPMMSGITITKNGIHIPQYSIPELSDSAYTFYGFGIKPLAFRMQPFTFDWFNFSGGPLSDWGFAFDLELSFPEFPDFVPPELRNPQVTILNAGYANGHITGTIETKQFSLPGLQLPLGGGLNYYVREIGGNLGVSGGAQNFNVAFRGDIQMPEALWCEGDSGRADIMSTAFTINGQGQLTGTLTNFIPTCPLNIGFGQLRITNSNVALSISGGQQSAIMDLSGRLRIPGTAEGDTIEAAGNISFDLINARILSGEIAINTPFRWDIPSDNPVLTFSINRAVLNSSGLLINGSNQLNLAEGATVGVNFNNLLIDIRNFNIVSGSATFSSQFALKFASELGGLNWSAVDLSAPIVEETAVRLTLPQNISLGTGGLAMSGETNILVRFGGVDYPDVRCVFSPSFNIDFSPFGISNGRADFYINQTMVAYIDSNGFHPGDFFGIIPLPQKLPLPDTNIAYIVLKDGDNVLVQTETVNNGLRISTRDNQPVQLVIPALQYQSPQPPTFGISFSVTVNTVTFQLVDGSIQVTPPQGGQSLLSLASAGIPLDLTRLMFARVNGTPTFMAGAKVALPGELNNVVVSLDTLLISPNGFSGAVSIGTFSEHYQQLNNYIVNAPLGDMFRFRVGGVQASFSQNSFSFRLSGDISTQLFSNEGDTAAIHYVAAWQNNQFGFSFDVSHMPDASLPLYIASFKPEAIGDHPAFDLSFPDGGFALTLSGTLSLDDFGDGFAVSFAGLEISSDGVTVPDISITTPEDFLSFALFSAQFEIKDVAQYKGLSFAYTNNVFYISLSGELTFLDNVSSFHGLKIGTNGSVSIEGVNLLSQEFYIVDNYLALTQIGIRSNAFFVEGFARLPEPCDTTRQTFNFSIAPDGTISGGATISIVSENPGLGGNDATEFSLWVATFDLTYAAINFNFADFNQSSLQLIADVYFMNDANKWLHIGNRSGGVIRPGFELRFDGSMDWGNFETAPGIFNINWDALKLDSLRIASYDTDNSSFGLSISGKLNVNISSVGGGLQFEDLHITSDGDVENLVQSIRGGDITITDIVTITISNIGWSSSPTDIEVSGGASCQDFGEEPNAQTNTIHVNSYFRFGASIDISGVGGGGVREFLTYTTDNSTHIIIDSAYVSIPDVVQFSLDFTYESGPDGFALLMGGRGVFVETYAIVVVGKIAHLNGETSFGLFVAVDVTITIPPCLVLTGIGGGFFYNPTECDLALVREMAGFGGDNPASGMISDPGSFAVLIYAQIAVVSDYLVSGSVLLTITENYFRLDGRVILLDQDTYLKGSIYLCIGFRNGFAEGNIEINITVGDFLIGNAGLSFYVYGSDAWGINGHIEVSILSILEANARLFIGNPGFLIQMSVSVSFDIWIIKISAGFEAMAWYKANVSWGLYAKVWVEAEAFWGLLTARGWLEAALIGAHGDWYIYGLAGVRGCILGCCKEGSVWVKIHDGDIDGGTGRNSEMDDIIEDAKNIGQEMEEEAEAAQDAINDAIIQSFLLTDAQLVSAFRNLYTYTQLLRQDNFLAQFFGGLFLYLVGDLQQMELTQGQAPPACNWNYCQNIGIYSWDPCLSIWTMQRVANIQEQTYIPLIYSQFFLNEDAPSPAGRDSLRTIRNRLDQFIATANQNRNQISDRLSQVSSNLAGIPELAFAFSNPVSSANFDLVSETYVQGDTTYKRAIVKPDFSLDDALASSNKESMEQAEEAFGNYEELIVDRIGTLESAIATVNSALAGSGNEISMDNFGRSYADLMFEISRFFASEAMYDRQEQLYARNMAIQLQGYQGTLQYIMTNKSLGMTNSQLHDLSWQRKRAILMMNLYPNVDTDSLNSFNQNWSALEDQPDPLSLRKQLCTQLGMQLWYQLCHRGFQHLDSLTAITMHDQIPVQCDDEMLSVEQSQSQYTAALDPIFDAKVALSEKLYDILSLYREWQEREPDTVQWLIPPGQVNTKRTALMQQLQVPQINTLIATAGNFDYFNYVALNWSASHPNGILDYSLNIRDQANPQPDVGLQSIGRRMSMVRYFMQPGNLTSQNWTLTMRARAGAGYTNQRVVNFATYYSPSGGGGVGSYQQSNMQGDNTPPVQPSVILPNYPLRWITTYLPQIGMYIDVPYRYSSSTVEINASWSSSDNESGVVEYQYSVGTSPGNTSVLGWSSAGGRADESIYGLTLQGGHTYYVNVKARNGANLWSTVVSSCRLVVDTTPPSTPAPVVIFEFHGPDIGGIQPPPPPVIPPIPLPAELIPPIGPPGPHFEQYFPGQPPQITTSWQASTDNESGIAGYQYRLILVSDTTVRSDDWVFVGDSLSITTNNSMLNYEDSFYVDIQAVNYAGLSSSSLRRGPYRPQDPSPPTGPAAALSYGLPAGTNYLIFSNRSHDYETGVSHYQIAVGNLPGNTNFLNWGYNFAPSDIGTANSWVLPNLGLAQGTTSYIHLRAVNGNGMVGSISITGPFITDYTPPITPIVSLGIYPGRPPSLVLTYSSISDPESYISYIEYAIGTTNGATDIRPWTNIGITNHTSVYYAHLGMSPGHTYYVGVRTTNRVNLVSQEFWTSIYIQ